MSKVTQEFYCTKSGGGCGGYFLAKLNTGIDGVVEVVCPNCGHKHQRNIDKGVIKEQFRFDNKPTQEIHPTKATFRTEPYTTAMRKKAGGAGERDAVVLAEQTDGKGNILSGLGRWIERFGDRQ